MYLARDLTSLSLVEIAREFNRDHSTVLHAIRAVSSRLEHGSETSVVLHRAHELLAAQDDATHPRSPFLHQPDTAPQPPSTEPSRTTTR
jgi:Bacterial dnaA protein helix-turn-helix